MFEKIRKKDGSIEDFDTNIIIEDITNAGKITKEIGEKEAKNLTLRALTLAYELRLGPIPESLEMQDIVERVLLDSPYYRTARRFIAFNELKQDKKTVYKSIFENDDYSSMCHICYKKSVRLISLVDESNLLICPECIQRLPHILDEKGLLKKSKDQLHLHLKLNNQE